MRLDTIRLGMIPIRGITPPDRGTLVYEFACLNITRAFHPGIDTALTPRTGLVTLIPVSSEFTLPGRQSRREVVDYLQVSLLTPLARLVGGDSRHGFHSGGALQIAGREREIERGGGCSSCERPTADHGLTGISRWRQSTWRGSNVVSRKKNRGIQLI